MLQPRRISSSVDSEAQRRTIEHAVKNHPVTNWFDELRNSFNRKREELSPWIMNGIRNYAVGLDNPYDPNFKEGFGVDAFFSGRSTAQDTYLMDRDTQRKHFKEAGFKEKTRKGDKIPTFQKYEDAVDPDKLVQIPNSNFLIQEGDIYFPGQNRSSSFHSNSIFSVGDKVLAQAGFYNGKLAIDGRDGKVYHLGSDVNDYGGNSEHNTRKYGYGYLKNKAADLLDRIGSPVRVTTGWQRIGLAPHYPNLSRESLGRWMPYGSFFNDNYRTKDSEGRIQDVESNVEKLVDDTMKSKGLEKYTFDDGSYMYALPEIKAVGRKR